VEYADRTTPGRARTFTPLRAALAVGVAVAAALIVWLVVRGDGGKKLTSATRAVPSIVTPKELSTLQSSLGHPIYWAGADPSMRYELTRTRNGNTYIRYLPPAAPLGDSRPAYLTVATYPLPNGYARMLAAAKEQHTALRKRRDGAAVLVNRKRPTSVYLAFPGQRLQVEVYDPSPAQALKLALSPKLAPVR
jgi:hypothetical protein